MFSRKWVSCACAHVEVKTGDTKLENDKTIKHGLTKRPTNVLL
jgi:hypothetical protein